ncbi:MAG TPA: GAF domain-containing protein, partial [Bacteroidetes bacterium]|nr:GAF domain-containing protein [Bacteroidota bacterium]HEX03554.1 GAF domain-containing protein [Bacteroidota bacterium]
MSDPSALLEFFADLENRLTEMPSGLRPGTEFDLFGKTAMLLASAVDEEDILAAMLDGLKAVLPYDAAGVYLADSEIPLGVKNKHGDHGELSVLVARGYSIEENKKFRQKFDDGIVGWVITKGAPVIVDDTKHDDRYIMLRKGTRSEISVPIISRDVIVGAINLESDTVSAFSEDSLRLLENLASYAAVALERAKTYGQLIEARSVERELEIATEIQTKLLPDEVPQLPGYDFAGFNVPSERVGGDYYDFIPITKTDVGIVVADVAGKGFGAGLVMASLLSALRMRVEMTYSIRAVMGNVNRFLHDSTGPERFVTAFYGVFDTITGRLTYV